MKVITEEGLRYVLKMHFGSDDVNQSICSHLINELQELDTLTVNKLRPMCEAPVIPEGELQVFVLVYLDHTEVPVIVSFDITGKWPHSAYHGIGWIPIPVYKPEQD